MPPLLTSAANGTQDAMGWPWDAMEWAWDVVRTKGLMLPAVNKVSIEDLPGGRGPKAMEAMMPGLDGWICGRAA